MVKFTKGEINCMNRIFSNPKKYELLKKAIELKGGQPPPIRRHADEMPGNRPLEELRQREPPQIQREEITLQMPPRSRNQQTPPPIRRNAEPNLFGPSPPMKFN